MIPILQKPVTNRSKINSKTVFNYNLQAKAKANIWRLKPQEPLTCIRRHWNALACPSPGLSSCTLPSFQADIVCVSSSSSVRFDP